MQINFKYQLDQLLSDYQRIMVSPGDKIVTDPSNNVAFLNDINQLITAIQNSKEKATDIRQHVLETITNIINRHFRNPSGPLDPGQINVGNVNPENFIQRNIMAYLDNIRDSIIKIKPPLNQIASTTPFADKQIIEVTNKFYDNIEPLVKALYDEFNDTRIAIEKIVLETNTGQSTALVAKNQSGAKPKPNLTGHVRKSPRLAQKCNQVNFNEDTSSSDDPINKNVPLNKLTSTVKRGKMPQKVKSLPSTPKTKLKMGSKTKTEPVERKQVRFDVKQTQNPNNPPKLVKPDIPDSLYDLYDPTMPDLEEINEQDQIRTNKRKKEDDFHLEAESPKPSKKKCKTGPKYVISSDTDPDEDEV